MSVGTFMELPTLVGAEGFEPSPTDVSDQHSNQLSYAPAPNLLFLGFQKCQMRYKYSLYVVYLSQCLSSIGV